MIKFKAFIAAGPGELEVKVNAWLNNNLSITIVRDNLINDGSRLTYTLLYTEAL